jgi:hypothetical protein
VSISALDAAEPRRCADALIAALPVVAIVLCVADEDPT